MLPDNSAFAQWAKVEFEVILIMLTELFSSQAAKLTEELLFFIS
jgi:hypothetical protein